MESDEGLYKATIDVLWGARQPNYIRYMNINNYIIVSYDITDTKKRTKFSKLLRKHGAIRLQFSVYEVKNTKRIIDNLVVKIETFAAEFTGDDSIILFEVTDGKMTKYGNAIHRDQPIVYF